MLVFNRSVAAMALGSCEGVNGKLGGNARIGWRAGTDALLYHAR